MRIGIDFGTTHTTAAFFDGQHCHFVPLDPANREPQLLRSMLYITKAHHAVLGIDAVATYLRDNTGRTAHMVPKVVGTIENTVARLSRAPLEPDGPIVIVYDVHVEEDIGAPGRLIQSIKTGLRDADYRGTTIYGRFYTVQSLIALLLSQVKQRAETHFGQAITGIALGRPVKFATNEAADQLAQDRLYEAALAAGFTNITFQMEPVAAAYFYTRSLSQPRRLLIFDFGGGTLDLTIMEATRQGQAQILATQGVLVGGDNFDSAIMRGKVASYFGSASSIDQNGHPFPSHLASKLYQWQTIPELSTAANLPTIRRARLHGNNAKAFAALESLARKNYGFALFERIEQAKRHLSHSDEAQLTMQADDIDLNMLLTRREFQAMILSEIAEVQTGIDRVLQKAAVSPGDIDVVVSTGGSSLIPVFRQILQRRFPTAVAVQSDTFGSVAAGLAIYASKCWA